MPALVNYSEIPVSCESAFAVTCLRMEERLSYSSTEEDMVLLHHEMEVEFPDEQPSENHRATLLEFGKMKDGKIISAMALTVGIPAGIAAMLLLVNKIKTRGVLRPIHPEVYVPALDMLLWYQVGGKKWVTLKTVYFLPEFFFLNRCRHQA